MDGRGARAGILGLRPSPDAQHALLLDLDLLKLRPRRGHDLRRTFITLAQVDGARRDLLEIAQGPRGDIINVYTTFPWPALCAEVQKLHVNVREGRVLDGDFRGLATTQRNWRNRWRKSATPAGFERPRNRVKPGDDRASPTEGEKTELISQSLTAESGSKVARLALVAMNAVRNGDLHRAVEVLQRIHDLCGTLRPGRSSEHIA
jgi:hypothetical protein